MLLDPNAIVSSSHEGIEGLMQILVNKTLSRVLQYRHILNKVDSNVKT